VVVLFYQCSNLTASAFLRTFVRSYHSVNQTAGVYPYAAQTFLNAVKTGLAPSFIIELCRWMVPLPQITQAFNLLLTLINNNSGKVGGKQVAWKQNVNLNRGPSSWTAFADLYRLVWSVYYQPSVNRRYSLFMLTTDSLSLFFLRLDHSCDAGRSRISTSPICSWVGLIGSIGMSWLVRRTSVWKGRNQA
jgi:hypothetical protein